MDHARLKARLEAMDDPAEIRVWASQQSAKIFGDTPEQEAALVDHIYLTTVDDVSIRWTALDLSDCDLERAKKLYQILIMGLERGADGKWVDRHENYHRSWTLMWNLKGAGQPLPDQDRRPFDEFLSFLRGQDA